MYRIIGLFVIVLTAALALEHQRLFRLDASPNMRSQLKLEGFDVFGPFDQHQSLYALLDTAEEKKFSSAHNLSLSLVQDKNTAFTTPEADAIGVPLSVPDLYKPLEEIEEFLVEVSQKFPAITKLVDIAAEYGNGPTYEGRPIWGLLISDNPNEIEREPTYILHSELHAREICTPEVTLDAINRLTQGYGVDEKVTRLVDSKQLWFIPLLNPDGYKYVFDVNSNWRKNRSPQGSTFGVDLNRNGNLGWYSSCSGSSNPTSITYKGPSPESEQETKAILGLARAYGASKYMDLHQSGAEVLYGYNCNAMQSSYRNFLQLSSQEMGAVATPTYRTRIPSADGEVYQTIMQDLTGCSFLVELATSGFQPVFSQCLSVVSGLRAVVDYFINVPESVFGFVTDEITGEAVVANIDISGHSWLSGESRTSHPRYGVFTLCFPDGTYTLTFTAPGYQTVQEQVIIRRGHTVELQVKMPK